MRRFALRRAYFYAGYVILNVALFELRTHGTSIPPRLWMLFILVAVGDLFAPSS
jgi:hypothetical protein